MAWSGETLPSASATQTQSAGSIAPSLLPRGVISRCSPERMPRLPEEPTTSPLAATSRAASASAMRSSSVNGSGITRSSQVLPSALAYVQPRTRG